MMGISEVGGCINGLIFIFMMFMNCGRAVFCGCVMFLLMGGCGCGCALGRNTNEMYELRCGMRFISEDGGFELI